MSSVQKPNNLQQWLQSINCVQHFTQAQMLNGLLIYNIMTHLNPNPSSSLKQLSTSSTTLTRVSNWNILTEQLKKYGIPVTQQTKSKIVNGNTDLVIEIVLALKQAYMKKQKASQVDISQIDPKKDIDDTKSLLELLLILIMKNFHLSSKEAVALLSNQSKYLAHILTKGLKGQFKHIETFISQLSRHIKKILQFCSINQENVIFFLRSLKPALISKSQSVSSGCVSFLQQFLLSHPFQQRLQIFQTHLLATYVLVIKRHPQMEAQVILTVLQGIGKVDSNDKKIKVKAELIKKLMQAVSTEKDKFQMILGIIKAYGEINKLQELMANDYFAKLIQNTIISIKQQQHSLISIDIVLVILQYLPSIFFKQEQQEHPTQYPSLQNIAESLQSSITSLTFPQVTSVNYLPLIIKLFTLLEIFGQEKHFIAPSLYRLLVQRFTELCNGFGDQQEAKHHHNQIYQTYLRNLTLIIEQFPSIPWQPIFNAVMAKLNPHQSEHNSNPTQSSINISETEIQFLHHLLTHPSIDIKTSLMIFDLSSKIFISTYYLGVHLTKLLVQVISSYMKTQEIIEELSIKFIKVCLSIHHGNVKKLSHKRKSVTGSSKIGHEDALMRIKNHSIEYFLYKTCELKQEDLNSRIQPLIALNYIQLKDSNTKEYSKGFKRILQLLGNMNDIVQKYEQELKKAEQEAKQLERLQKQRQKQEKMPSTKHLPKAHTKSRYDTSSEKKHSSFFQQPNSILTTHHNSLQGQLSPIQNRSFAATSFIGVTPSALKGIEKFQKVYLEKIQRQDLEKIKRQQEEERFELMKKVYRKKMMSHGIDIKGQADNIQYLFEFDSQENAIIEKHFLKVPYYKDQTEEDTDMLAVEKLLKSYQKALKLIFSIYSGQKKGFIPQNFDQIAERNTSIPSSQLYKLMKDFGFQDYISLKQVQNLTQKINYELNPSTVDYQILDFNLFNEFIKQSSFLMFTRPPKDLRGQPLAMMLEETLSNFKLFAAENKINEQIFEEPTNIFFNETEAVTELNKKLAKNPDYILPEGYKKIVQKKIVFSYGIFLEAMSPTYKIVFEVVDELLHKMLGIHVIQPFTKEEKVTRARPALFVAERLKIDSMPAKHIPILMKKEIMKLPIKSRPEGKECAIVLDEIIEAIQLNHTSIGQKHMNKILVQKQKLSQQQKRQLQIEKRKRQNRNRQAKSAIEQYKSKKEEKQKQLTMKKQSEEKRLKQEKQQKQREQEQLKKKLQQYSKKKKEEEEEKMRKKKQLQEKQKRERERLKQLNEQTKKKLQQERKKREQEQLNKKLQKQQLQKKLKLEEKKKMHQSQILKKKMVEDFKLKKSNLRDTSENKTLVKNQRTSSKKNLQSYDDVQDSIK